MWSHAFRQLGSNAISHIVPRAPSPFRRTTGHFHACTCGRTRASLHRCRHREHGRATSCRERTAAGLNPFAPRGGCKPEPCRAPTRGRGRAPDARSWNSPALNQTRLLVQDGSAGTKAVTWAEHPPVPGVDSPKLTNGPYEAFTCRSIRNAHRTFHRWR